MKNREIMNSEKLNKTFSYIQQNYRNAPQIILMMKFSFFVGMRMCNFINLQIKDVLNLNNTVKDCISLRGNKNKGGRIVNYYINQNMKNCIMDYLSSWNLSNREAYLFVSYKTKKPFIKNTISNLFHNIFSAVGIENCSTHLGRRTFITNLLTHGIDITTVKTLVGHKNISTTTLYYNENPAMLLDVVNKFYI